MSNDPYSSPEAGDVFGASKQKSNGCLWASLFTGAIVVLLVFLLLPAMSRRGMPAAKRTQCKNNLKQIGLALHNYHDVHGAFPPAVVVDENGQKLHSWRTLILPYMEQQSLYDSIDLTKPWHDPVNAAAYETVPMVFACPSADIPSGHTTYMALVGDDCFLSEREPRKIRDITGGTTSNIAVIEVPVTRSVHWMEPTDLAVDFVAAMQPQHDVAHQGGVHALIADGSVRFVSLSIAPETMQKLVSISEGVTAEW